LIKNDRDSDRSNKKIGQADFFIASIRFLAT
jgi:hypothetical protein